jgi:glutaredoxin 3
MRPDVVVYTSRLCFYCVRAKQLLAKKGVPFRDIDVRTLDDGLDFLRERTGRTSVPQIFVDGAFVGGYYELAQMEREGTLDRLLDPGRNDSGDSKV